MKELKKLSIVSANGGERIFLDGEELPNVAAYKLENSASSKEPAKLTVTVYVVIDQVDVEVQM